MSGEDLERQPWRRSARKRTWREWADYNHQPHLDAPRALMDRPPNVAGQELRENLPVVALQPILTMCWKAAQTRIIRERLFMARLGNPAAKAR
jgi:hypothetical protein